MKKVLLFICIISTLVSCKEKKKPNVIFILADDLGWMDLSCMGSDFYETPNIDALAAKGVKFTNAYTASPLCSPTRASILTGQEPGRLRFTTPTGHLKKVELNPKETSKSSPIHKTATPQTRTRLPNDYLTFAEVMKEDGYATAFMGKWHLGRDPYLPENQGFDLVVGGREHPGPPGPGGFFSPWNCETLPVVPEGTHVSDVLTDEALKFVENKREEPFLLCLWYYDVHAPFQAKEELIEKYKNKLSDTHVQRSAIMGAMIETMDTNIGRLTSKLEELGLDENTIIVFTSDNGGNMYDGPEGTIPTNNYPLRAGKGNNYEGGVRVPLIVNVPGMTKAGTTSDVITSTVDHYATVLELVNLPFPQGLVTDGQSFVPALKGETYERAPIYSTFCHNVVATGNRANVSMRQGPWRFYKFYFDGPNQEHRYELYNLDNDISEKNNLAEEMHDKVKEMARLLDEHTAEAGILLPQKNENYGGNVADAWIGSEDTEIAVGDGSILIASKGSNPSIETVYTPNVSGQYKLTFEMKSSSSGQGKVAWKARGDKEYISENVSAFAPIHDESWHAYSVELSPKSNLDRLRITPSSSKGNIAIRNIELTTMDGYYIRDWPIN
ncbi:sulfatase [Marinoscillum furvescens]|uniref:Arylsulfatase A-like enzyme n=1 Tax=Marinoscillum furvescens DSM 4134 TaxID=1122208 RepID=A0A3D9L1X2_MARFU|nr:sulfatase [Marinoscillum furvescens]RED98352.1 arylsulfatase A-like enzyme [Marinoscillum furvescens DSM 4134]